jgi:glycosyltransferase involved in cell wall biosynthesis
MNAEKGIPELAQAFARIAAGLPSLHLVLAGPDEGGSGDGMRRQIAPVLAPFADRVHMPGLVNDPEAFMAAADLLVLPSHREGFGLSVLEAAACGIPSIGTAIYGLTDAIVADETGLLVPVRDEAALAEAIRALALDGPLRERLGAAGRARVLERFTRSRLEHAFLAFMADRLGVGAVHSPA